MQSVIIPTNLQPLAGYFGRLQACQLDSTTRDHARHQLAGAVTAAILLLGDDGPRVLMEIFGFSFDELQSLEDLGRSLYHGPCVIDLDPVGTTSTSSPSEDGRQN